MLSNTLSMRSVERAAEETRVTALVLVKFFETEA